MTDTAKSDGKFRVAIFADFVCPYSFLAVEQIDRLAREYNLEPMWRPHWLHPDTPPEGTPRERTPEAEARAERRNAWIKEMAPDQFERMHYPEKRQYSFLAFEALEFACDHGRDFAFKTAVYDLMWTEGGDIGEVETLMAAGERAGLDPAEMQIALHERIYAERALAAVVQARDLGIMNTPTIFLGKTRINGWTYYEVMQQVMEQQGMRPQVALAS
ncbi:MAG: oxidoreductase [Betaproteobacteria bacterium]|nr:oxidoreductase [Betaproteobacteria bacterium]